jgi:hypothetical protein
MELQQVMLNSVAVDGTPVSSSAPKGGDWARRGEVAPAHRLKRQPVCGKRQAAVPVMGPSLQARLPGGCPLRGAREYPPKSFHSPKNNP